jgi:hypothetical protein
MKKNTSYLFSILVLPLLFVSFLFTINTNTVEAQCTEWEPYTDVWYAQGCEDYHAACAPGYYRPPGTDPEACIPIPTGGGGTTSTTNNTNNNSGGSCDLPNNPKFNNLVDYIVCIINISVIPLILGLALVVFVYGVMQYVLNEADEGKREKGKQFMVWGIVALTVMLSVWGLVAILGGTFGLNISIIPQVSTN